MINGMIAKMIKDKTSFKFSSILLTSLLLYDTLFFLSNIYLYFAYLVFLFKKALKQRILLTKTLFTDIMSKRQNDSSTQSLTICVNNVKHGISSNLAEERGYRKY